MNRILENHVFAPQFDVAAKKYSGAFIESEHIHDFTEIIMVTREMCCIRIEKKEQLLYPGDICILGVETGHTLYSNHPDAEVIAIAIKSSTFKNVFSGMMIPGSLLDKFFTKTLFGNHRQAFYMIFKTGNHCGMRNFFYYVLDEYVQRRKYNNYMMNTIVSSIMVLLLRDFEKNVLVSNPQNSQEVNVHIMEILVFMEEQAECISLKTLAEKFHYSERHMARMLREYTGFSYKELMHKIRLQRAIQLICHTSMSVEEIIFQVGYVDKSYFYKLFKNQYHMTPNEYRSKHSLQEIMKMSG